jgi:hypothetical protein
MKPQLSEEENGKNNQSDRKALKTLYFNVDTVFESYQDKDKSWKRRFEGYKFEHNMKLEFASDNVLLGKAVCDSQEKAEVLTSAAGVEHRVKLFNFG